MTSRILNPPPTPKPASALARMSPHRPSPDHVHQVPDLNRARLTRAFFRQAPEICAHDLIGCTLLWGGCAGRIVETEAYAAEGDAACHTAFRPSARQFIENHPPGVAYIYLNYGLHWMFNLLTKSPEGSGFVLIRALEPLCGQALMRERRQRLPVLELCSGPGKLAQALALSGADQGRDLCAPGGPGAEAPVAGAEAPVAGAGPAEVCRGEPRTFSVLACPRIGIRREREKLWRFVEKDSPFVSVAPPPPKRAAG